MAYILLTLVALMCFFVIINLLFILTKYFSSITIITKTIKWLETIDNNNNKNNKMYIKKHNNNKHRQTSSYIVKPYSVTFSEELVNDLKARLKNTREDKNKNCTKNNTMHEFLDYWANGYDFQKREIYINMYQHFKMNSGLEDIHFIHVKPHCAGTKKILPLLLLHGWPSSITEFYKIIPLLTTPRPTCDFVFEVIAPSLPGFGFSSASTSGCVFISMMLKNLMLMLGHDKFYIQGGDWSAIIIRVMSTQFAKHVLGIHCNMCALLDKPDSISSCPSSCLSLAKTTKQVISSNKLLADTKYFQIQAVKPETIAIGLNDSPAALAAYIIEKFLIGTNYSMMNDEFLQKYSYDELIDNIMMYWTSKSITTAMKIYAEQFIEPDIKGLEKNVDSLQVKVPSAFSQFFNKIPESVTVQEKQFVNLLRVTYTVRNGRFPAIEEPDCFADDIWTSINAMEMWNKSNN